MTLPQLIQRLRDSQASAETICNVMHVWQQEDRQPDLSIDQLVYHVCIATGINKQSFFSKRRFRNIVAARFILMHYLRYKAYKKHRLTDIGKVFNKDHTTVIYGLQLVEDMLSINDKDYMFYYENFLRSIRGEQVRAKTPIVKTKVPGMVKMYYDRKQGIYAQNMKTLSFLLGHKWRPTYEWIKAKYGTRIQIVYEKEVI